jgi:hypothetical protein
MRYLKGDVTGGWRKLWHEELHNSYSSPDIVRKMKIKEHVMGGACIRFGGVEKCSQNVRRKT